MGASVRYIDLVVGEAQLTFSVNLLHQLESLQRRCLNSTPPDRTGVVDENIDPAELRDDITDEFVDAGMVADITR